MGASYAYAVGNVRARESSLLTRQDLDQLLVLSGADELLSVLRDKAWAGRRPTDPPPEWTICFGRKPCPVAVSGRHYAGFFFV